MSRLETRLKVADAAVAVLFKGRGDQVERHLSRAQLHEVILSSLSFYYEQLRIDELALRVEALLPFVCAGSADREVELVKASLEKARN